MRRPAYLPYMRPMPATWWFRNIRYVLFILREFSSIFLGLFVVIYLSQFALLLGGPDIYSQYATLMRSPVWIALHSLIFLFAIIHSLTWIYLMPAVIQAPILRRRSVLWALRLAVAVLWIGLSVAVGFMMLNSATAR